MSLRWLALAVSLVLSVALTVPAQATKKKRATKTRKVARSRLPAKKGAKAKRKTKPKAKVVDFLKDDEIIGTLKRPESEYIRASRKGKFKSLIKVRLHFVKEIVKSVDRL